jgi:DNA anti-recombination protein RmuC
MSGLAFDTLAYARRLESAGFSRAQAEALAEEQAKLIDDRLATKNDIAELSANLERGLAAVRADLERGLAELRVDLERGLAELRVDLEKTIVKTRTDLEKAILETRKDLEKSILESRNDILKWIVGAVGLQTLVILSAAVALARLVR